jgi:hypothetical protein
MEEGLDLNIQDGSKHDKYISYWLYYYTYLNTLGRADKRKQTMSVLFNDETDSPQRLEDTMNYLEPILQNVRMVASGNSDRVDWTGDILPINDIQRYKLSNKRKMKDWLCFPAISRRGGVKGNNSYLQVNNTTGEYSTYSKTRYAFGKMLQDYFAVSEENLREANKRKTYLHPSIIGGWREYHSGLNQNILSKKRTIASNFLNNYQNKILATEHWESPTSGVARYHDSFSKYFTLDSFLDFFKPEVYQGGNLDEVDSEDAKNKLKQAKLFLKGMRKQLREINNQIEEHEKNIEEMVREINWIKDGRRIKGQKKQLDDIIEAIYFLDEQMYEKIKIASEKSLARITRILKKIGYNEKQIYNRYFHNYSNYSKIKQRLSKFLYMKNYTDSDPKYGNLRLREYKNQNKTLEQLLIKIKSKGVDYFQRPLRFSYWSNHLDWRQENIIPTFERMNREITLNVLRKIIPCKSILVNEGRTKLPSALSLYSKSDAYVSLEGLNKYANLRIVGHKYYKVFQGDWKLYMKSLKEVKDYDRILITPLIEFKSQYDLGRSVFFIPAGMKIISNAWKKPMGLQYSRGYYQNDMETIIFNEQAIGNIQRELESIYNRIMNKTKNPFAKRKRMTEREERMMDWSILELRLKANEDLGFLNW